MKTRFGYRHIDYPSADLGELQDSCHLLNDMPVSRQRMGQDGYLLLRGLIDRKKVRQARQTILDHMAAHEAFTQDTPVLEGVMPRGGLRPMEDARLEWGV